MADTWLRVLPYAVATLQLCAALVYLSRGEYRLAIIWAGVSLSNAALAGIR